MKKTWLILLIVIMAWLQGALNVAVNTLDNPNDSTATLGNWERNSKYKLQVKLINNDGVAQDFNRVEANLDFDSTKITLLGKTDNITNWSATNFFLVTNGHVQYQRAAGGAEGTLIVPAHGELLLYELQVQVNANATLGNSATVLDQQFTHVLKNILDLTGSLQNLNLNLVSDTTAPVTRIIPAESFSLDHQISVTLEVDPDTNKNCGDLKEIHYTTDGSVPLLSSPLYTVPVLLPVNATTTLRWFGYDNSGNSEAPQLATYRIDTIKPTITNVNLQPQEPVRVKKWAVVTINAIIQDETALSNVFVKVGDNPAQFVSKVGSLYTFKYLIQEGGNGYKTVSLTAIDQAGNTALNNSKEIYIDNLAPTFSINSVTPGRAGVGNVVVFEFTASEELDLNRSTITIGTNSPAGFIAKNGLKYKYSRLLDGSETSGWIMIHGCDQAGNVGYNLAGNSRLTISGYDLLNNYGETTTSFNIYY